MTSFVDGDVRAIKAMETVNVLHKMNVIGPPDKTFKMWQISNQAGPFYANQFTFAGKP